MAFKLTKEESETRAKHVDKLRGLATEIETAVGDANLAIAAACDTVQGKIAEYNAELTEATGLVSDIHARLEGEFDDKSEKWQEGERGQEVRAFVDEWSGGEFDELSDLDVPEIEVDATEHADMLENLSSEVE